MAGGRGRPCPPDQVRRRAGPAIRGSVGRPPAGRPAAASQADRPDLPRPAPTPPTRWPGSTAPTPPATRTVAAPEPADGQGVDQQLGDDRRDEGAPGPPWPVLRASCPRKRLTRSDRAPSVFAGRPDGRPGRRGRPTRPARRRTDGASCRGSAGILLSRAHRLRDRRGSSTTKGGGVALEQKTGVSPATTPCQMPRYRKAL